jgi:hypothetical protein
VAVPGSIVALLTPQQTQQSIGSSRSRSRSVSRQLFRVSDADPAAGQLDPDAQFALGSTPLATLGEAIMCLTPGQCRASGFFWADAPLPPPCNAVHLLTGSAHSLLPALSLGFLTPGNMVGHALARHAVGSTYRGNHTGKRTQNGATARRARKQTIGTAEEAKALVEKAAQVLNQGHDSGSDRLVLRSILGKGTYG